MVQELWIESEARETAQGIVTEWFIFAFVLPLPSFPTETSNRDDDTFFPDFSSLARLLANYDSSEDHLIGALSEATGQVRRPPSVPSRSANARVQVQEFGVMAFGGAGIHISKGLMRKMNAPGVCTSFPAPNFTLLTCCRQ